MRRRTSWSSDDSLVVLASYFDRPRGMAIPPARERERIASVLRQEIEEVTRRFGMYAALEAGKPAEETETALWAKYRAAPLDCAMAVDELLAAWRQVPFHLRKRAL